jgi:hypothetical protein
MLTTFVALEVGRILCLVEICSKVRILPRAT